VYHTPNDTAAAIRSGSLQTAGDNLLAGEYHNCSFYRCLSTVPPSFISLLFLCGSVPQQLYTYLVIQSTDQIMMWRYCHLNQEYGCFWQPYLRAFIKAYATRPPLSDGIGRRSTAYFNTPGAGEMIIYDVLQPEIGGRGLYSSTSQFNPSRSWSLVH